MASDPAFRRQRLILAVLVTAVFFGSLVLLAGRGMFASPDENANAFFARTFAATGRLTAFEPLNLEFGDLIVPRSVISLHGFLAPGGFLGLPAIEGAVIRVLGDWSLLLVTPFLAALAAFAWFGIARRVFGQTIGFVSALLLATLPAWWYYASRSLMPNVPFAAFAAFAAYFLVARPLASRSGKLRPFAPDAFLAGACLSVALSVRLSEAAWLGAASLAALWIMRRALNRRAIAVFFAGVAVAAVPFLVLNQRTYGGPFAVGYTAGAPSSDAALVVQAPVAEPQPSGPAAEAWGRAQESVKPLFPFGIHPRNVLRNAFSHGLYLFWWMTLLTIGGAVLLLRDRSVPADERRVRLAYHAFALVATAWLFVMYGSWNVHDNPDPNAISIGNSYVRYWLPAFVLSTPYAAGCLAWLAKRPLTARGRQAAIAALAVACAALSIQAVYYPKTDGLVSAVQTLRRSADIKRELLGIVETDAVVVTDRGDKLLFPERRVRYPLRDETTYALLPKLVRRVPLYYYGVTLPETDMAYLNDVKLHSLGLNIVLVKTFDAESLYRIVPADEVSFAIR